MAGLRANRSTGQFITHHCETRGPGVRTIEKYFGSFPGFPGRKVAQRYEAGDEIPSQPEDPRGSAST